MKNLLQLVITLTILLVITPAFANKQPDCLSKNTVANITFTSFAKYTDSHREDYWVLMSDNFEWEGSPWNVAFFVHLPNVPKDKVLEEGRRYFKKVTVEEPNRSVYGNQVICDYGIKDEYVIGSFSPPVKFPIESIIK